MSTLTQDQKDQKDQTKEKTQSCTSTESYAQFGPKLKTTLPGPLAQKVVAADDRLISPSYTRSYPWSPNPAAHPRHRRRRQRVPRLRPRASPSTPPGIVTLK